MSEEEPILKEGDVTIVSKEEDYWAKALSETEQTIEKFESALKFETAVKEMIEQKLKNAKEDSS